MLQHEQCIKIKYQKDVEVTIVPTHAGAVLKQFSDLLLVCCQSVVFPSDVRTQEHVEDAVRYCISYTYFSS